MTHTIDDSVEAALESLGWPWSRRNTGWAVPANPHLLRELTVTPTDSGVRVSATLVEADAPTPALGRFLDRALSGLRGCSWERDGEVFRVVSQVSGERIDADLGKAVGAVAVAVRLLGREAAALLDADAAAAYETFHAKNE
jgi:hypothetical protein